MALTANSLAEPCLDSNVPHVSPTRTKKYLHYYPKKTLTTHYTHISQRFPAPQSLPKAPGIRSTALIHMIHHPPKEALEPPRCIKKPVQGLLKVDPPGAVLRDQVGRSGQSSAPSNTVVQRSRWATLSPSLGEVWCWFCSIGSIRQRMRGISPWDLVAGLGPGNSSLASRDIQSIYSFLEQLRNKELL